EVRRAPLTTPDPVPERQRMTPVNPANLPRTFCGVSRRPFRDRVIHLLALRSHRKPELLAHLQRNGVTQKDRDSLGNILQQVRSGVCTSNFSLFLFFYLKAHLFQDIQKDWSGYSGRDRRTLEIILSRKAAASENATSTS
ncbi:ELL2 factor, partial [Sakesphorus luctuosus]|nr:ELL2 factor [Sakesphorus luctuosus]